MKIRNNFNLQAKPSLLGFGCMRFPTYKDAQGNYKIDYPLTEEMIEYALEKGVNYIDTAYPYHNGESEIVVGKIMKKYPRDSFFLATKLPMWKVDSKESVRNIFNEQLEKLQMDYVDFYLLHALDRGRFDKVIEYEVIQECLKLKEEGKIKYLGFSFHDDYEVFERIINHYDWDFCQIQFNYMDTEEQAGLKGLKLAGEKNIPVVIMEPIKGGSLANLSDDVNRVFKSYNEQASAASWALRYVASFPEVMTVLSGMSNFEQVKDNINTFTDFKELNEEENELVVKVKDLINSKIKSRCTGCEYCMPCPRGVNIPRAFRTWNVWSMYNKGESFINQYKNGIKETGSPLNCIACGKCEKLCPQKISIIEDLKKVAKDFQL